MKAIVVTTVNPPSTGIRDLPGRGWEVYVVGDGKTPASWRCPGVNFYDEDASDQFALSHKLPRDHYSRKNLGYLEAIAGGAEVIFETDDDHLLYGGALDGLSESLWARISTWGGWLNVYSAFSDDWIWPRGFPLERVCAQGPHVSPEEALVRCPIQQFLVDGDADTDAIYRMTFDAGVVFNGGRPLALGCGTFSPFNSQATLWYPEAYPYMYLPSYVSFRMTDIWRSFIAHRCIVEDGGYVAFRAPNARQNRNPHDFLRDFEDEIPGYLNNGRIVDHLWKLDLEGSPPFERLMHCYEELSLLGIISPDELPLLDAWISGLV